MECWIFNRAGLLETVASELAMNKLHLIVVQAVRWVEVGSQPADNYTFFFGMLRRTF
jgi:hypothetical protein